MYVSFKKKKTAFHFVYFQQILRTKINTNIYESEYYMY